jgi:hypothetical protein
MRWLFLILTVVCIFLAFDTHDPNVLGLSMLGALVFGFIAVMGFVQARIEAGAQSHASMIGSRDVQAVRQGLQKKAVLDKVAQLKAQAAQGARRADAGDDA